GSFGVHDAAPRRHPIDLTRTDRRHDAKAVAVHDLAVEHIGHRRKPDMRVRPHIEALARLKFRRPEMIEEDERAEHARRRRRQRAAHREIAEVYRPRHDNARDGITCDGVPGRWVLATKEAHVRSINARPRTGSDVRSPGTAAPSPHRPNRRTRRWSCPSLAAF